MFWVFLLNLAVVYFCPVNGAECREISFTSLSTDLGSLHIIQRIAIVSPLNVYFIKTEISDDQRNRYQLHSPNGSPLVIYSSLTSATIEWQILDELAQRIYIVPVYETDNNIIPLVLLTVCQYASFPSYLNDNLFTIDTYKVGVVSMYENHLDIIFRTFESGIFVFSMADQGDLLIAQIVHGRIDIIFDFGSLSHSVISGGIALNDGEWHRLKWVHQFDSVTLFIDGIKLNSTVPFGLYRKMDFDTQIHVGGRPPDDVSTGIETTFHGCLARVTLNNIDLLAELPSEQRRHCQMPRPQLMTILSEGLVIIPFTFMPFTIDFRILHRQASILLLTDEFNKTLMHIILDDQGMLLLTANGSTVKQVSHPRIMITDGSWHAMSLMIWGTRFHFDIDGYTVLWLEGNLVRGIAKSLANFHLSAPGCYRSTTVLFRSANILGNVSLDICEYNTKCVPNPCENGAICHQTTLSEFSCKCQQDYYGKLCHATNSFRSCEEFFANKTFTAARNVSIDIDGGHELTSFKVNCHKLSGDIDTNSPIIRATLFHDSSRSIYVTGEIEPGAVRKALNYRINEVQMELFIDGFESCEQYMRYECRGGAKLMTYGQEKRPSSWYGTRNGQHGLQWADAQPYSRLCSCAMNSSCNQNRGCNCDSGEDGIDEGFNNHFQLLPITNLYLGGTTEKSSINVSIGPLVCTHRMVFDAITFRDRDARITGSQSFTGVVFDISLDVRFSHSKMSIFIWESKNSQRWFQLYITDGRIVGQVVNGGKVIEIETKRAYNDNEWHSVYWEVNYYGMVLLVDGENNSLDAIIILPQIFSWIIGSRTRRGQSGFAGCMRNFHLCGKELVFSSLLQKSAGITFQGIEIGENGSCMDHNCQNSAKCIEYYDTFKCDCKETPFTGSKCDQDVGMSVPLGSQLSIPWQHPGQVASFFRIAVQTESANFTLIHAHALFADSEFNLTVNSEGYLELSVFDGFFFQRKASNRLHKINENEMADVKFCANKTGFHLSVNNRPTFFFVGNWSFFLQLNVWKFLDTKFTGCITRLQIGNGFPLKDPSSSRFSYKGNIRFGSCPFDQLLTHVETDNEDDTVPTDIKIFAVAQHKASLMILTPIISVISGSALFLLILTIICWLRSRPEGEYKTNENVVTYCSSSRPEDPLVVSNLGREYFC